MGGIGLLSPVFTGFSASLTLIFDRETLKINENSQDFMHNIDFWVGRVFSKITYT
jgi:hypothetical protein